MLKHHNHVATVARLPLGLCAKDVGQVTEVHKTKNCEHARGGSVRFTTIFSMRRNSTN